jgi:hypothetical protein
VAFNVEINKQRFGKDKGRLPLAGLGKGMVVLIGIVRLGLHFFKLVNSVPERTNNIFRCTVNTHPFFNLEKTFSY